MLCPRCGGVLDPVYDLDALRTSVSLECILSRRPGVWRWREFLPVADESCRIDIGAGASHLVDALMDRGYQSITVLDVSEKAMAVDQARLGPRASQVQWIAADVTSWEPKQRYALWHDRAVFHFLTDEQDRSAYVERLKQALAPRGQAIIGTFALDGPERCSGLPVVRYDAASLGRTLGEGFALEQALPYDHHTPWGSLQRFQFSRFRKLP